MLAPRPYVDPESEHNPGTLIVDPAAFFEVGQGGGIDAKALFSQQYGQIAPLLRKHPSPGAGVLAVDPKGTLLGSAWVRAGQLQTRALIVGRHSHCDLRVPSWHPDVALRQAAILVRGSDDGRVHLRIVDLQTTTGFSDEAGRSLRAVSADGSLFLRIGSVTLLVVMTGAWPEIPGDADEAYALIPERAFLDESWDPPPRRGDGSQTIVRSQLAPMQPNDLRAGSEPAYGFLSAEDKSWPVGRRALERGVLIGRYSRCHLRQCVQASNALSRVHLLVIADGGEILAIDTASSNGTRVRGQEIRERRLGDDVTLDLAGELKLRWRVAH